MSETETPAEAVRKPWSRPELQVAEVAERTNKKGVTPSDGITARTLS